MSALHSFSQMIGRAMHLPDFFYTPIPLTNLLDTAIPVPGWGARRKPGTRRRFKHTKRTPARNAKGETTSGARSNQFVLEGEIRPGNSTKFAIGTTDFVLTPTTWVIGELHVGIQARVKGVVQGEEGYQATSIVMLAQ